MTAIDGEYDLFGVPVAPLKPREEPRPAVNDMNLVEKVLRTASAEGFVLVGRREDVYQRTTGDVVERASSEVDFAVHQLIEAKWLTVGGTHHVRYSRYTGPARSVLVPRKTKDATYRWRALHKPRCFTDRSISASKRSA